MYCHYRLNERETDYLTAGIEVRVAEPTGDDLRVYELLQKDSTLARMMMSPVHVPDPETTAVLETLVKLFPKSSYADYARLAIARAALKNYDVRVRITASEEDAKLEEIDRIVTGSDCLKRLPHLQVRPLVAWLAESSAEQAELTRLVEDVVAAHDKPEDLRRDLIRQLVRKRTELAHRRRAATIEHLERVSSKEFPYYDYVLVMLRGFYIATLIAKAGSEHFLANTSIVHWDTPVLNSVIALDTSGKLTRVMDALTGEYADSLTWNMSNGYSTPEEWKEIRSRIRHEPR